MRRKLLVIDVLLVFGFGLALISIAAIVYREGYDKGFAAGKASVVHKNYTARYSVVPTWNATVDGIDIEIKASCEDQVPDASK